MTTRKSSSKSSDGSQAEPKKTPTPKAAAPKAKKPASKRAPKASAEKAKTRSKPSAEAPQPPKHDQQDELLSHMPQAYLEKLDEISRNVLKASLSGQKLLSERVRRSLEGDPSMMPQADPLHANPEVLNTWEHILSDPELLMQSQADLYAGYLDLWSNATRRMMSGEASDPVITPDPADKRWKSDAWRDHPLFDAMKQSYLLNQRFLMGLVDGAKGVDEATKRKVQFLTQQWSTPSPRPISP
jgi:polyhydroxyalkanoate synthase